MKRAKRFLAVLLSMAMVLAMTTTAFAEGEGTGAFSTGSTTDAATIQGIEDEAGVSVVAYQIISYNTNGYYEEVLTDTISKNTVAGQQPTLNPTPENVQTLYYNRLSDLKTQSTLETFTKQSDGTWACANLGLGTWLVVVNGAKNTLYNPAIISVSVGPDGTQYGTLNLDTKTWNNGETYIKKSEPTITKTAESAMNPADKNVVGTQFGDILKFTVSADIPAYTSQKTNIDYEITDTLTGLTLVSGNQYPVNASITGATNADNTTAQSIASTAITDGAMSFTVSGFENEFLIRNAGKKITITYYAKVTSTELINVDRLNNTAQLKYSNNSDTSESSNTVSTNTKHYTFGIDTGVEGWKDSTVSNNTGEFIKINDKGDVSYNQTPGEVVTTSSNTVSLNGAEFQLHIGSAEGPLFTDKQSKSTFTTSGNGRLQIVGLDDNVAYYLVETKAPEGYTLNATPVKVYIKATYAVDPKTGLQDVLTGYEVQIGEGNEQRITHYGYDYGTGKTEFKNTADKPSNPFGFRNTTLTSLPSTGGIGTTIFTVGGCIIMIIAAGLFFASRRKKAAN